MLEGGTFSGVPMNELLSAALKYAAWGWHVVPLHNPTKNGCSCRRKECIDSNGKHPRIDGWTKNCTIDPEVINSWWDQWPDANVGIVTGKISNLVVFDVDPRNGGDETVASLGEIPETVQCLSGGGGTHDYYLYPDKEVKSTKNELGDGIDIQSDGRMVVAPPSLHHSGRKYQWEIEHDPEDFKQIVFPECLRVQEIRNDAPKLAPAIENKIPQKSRNKTLTSVAGTMRRRGLKEGAIEAALLEVNKDCEPPLEISEVKGIAKSVAQYAPAALQSSNINQNLPEAPLKTQLVSPPGWGIGHNGIWRNKVNGDSSMVSVLPVLVSEKHIDLDENTQKLTLSFFDKKKWDTVTVSKEIIANQNKIIALSHLGLPFHSGNAKQMVQWLHEMEFCNEIPTVYTSSKCGWKNIHDSWSFVFGEPYDNPLFTFRFESDNGNHDQIRAAVNVKGSHEEWLKIIEKIKPFPKAMIALYHSFASPLLRLLNAPNFIVDYAGVSSVGKSTALNIAASPWGFPSDKGGMINSWDSTKVYVERFANAINDLPFFLDESHKAREDTASAILYMLANGIGRGRGSLKGVQRTLHWQTVVFSSGERPIVNSTKFGGASARVITYWGSPFGEESQEALVKEINWVLSENYGHAGRMFVLHLLQNQALWPSLQQMYQDKVKEYSYYAQGSNAGIKGRVIQYYAISYVAGRLANELFEFEDDVNKTIINGLEEAMSNLDEASYGERAYQWARSWISSNSPSFMTNDQTDKEIRSPRQWYGKWLMGNKEVAIFPDIFEKACKEKGFDYDVILRTFRDEGKTRCEKGRLLHQFRFKTGKDYGILLKIED